jgi:transposase
MYYVPKTRKMQVLVGLLWLLAVWIYWEVPLTEEQTAWTVSEGWSLPGVVAEAVQGYQGDPWRLRYRIRRWAWRQYCAWRRATRRARYVAQLGRLALRGALTLAQLVDLMTESQLRYQLGALPILYALLEALQVRQIINRHCPTRAQVDHGLVALVLILNRLSAPRPLYRIADWLAQTVLVYQLGVPASKFNDDRLARTLAALSEHTQAIWQDIVHRAWVQADIDLQWLFYDLSAFILHGEYAQSAYADFGFAHNTPMNKRKIKVGLNVSGDGYIPTAYSLWPGRTTDQATVQANMERLCQLLRRHGWDTRQVCVIGDRANLNDQLAFAYQAYHLRYVAGLPARKKVHQALLTAVPSSQMRAFPLQVPQAEGRYWGRLCEVPFKHEGRHLTQRGLVVLSGPVCAAQRRSRAAQLRALHQALQELRSKIGQPYYRTVKALQRRANSLLNKSPAGKFMHVIAELDAAGHVSLHWQIDRFALWQAMERDGRYLLVTNDWSLSAQQIFDLYRQKAGVEQRFRVTKSELRVSPIYLHKDPHIEGMLLIHMLALLAYSLLERQVRQQGLALTTRRILQQLETLVVIETRCRDGSRLFRLVPITPEQTVLLQALATVLADLQHPHIVPPRTPLAQGWLWALPPPATSAGRC